MSVVMKNKYNQCCCEDIIGETFECLICSLALIEPFNCLTQTVPQANNRQLTLINPPHPDSNNEVFLFQGVIRGTFFLTLGVTRFRIYYGINLETHAGGFLEFSYREDEDEPTLYIDNYTTEDYRTDSASTRIELIKVVSHTENYPFCISFDTGVIAIFLGLDFLDPHAIFVSTNYVPTDGGFVGYRTVGGVSGHISSFHRAASESRDPIVCESCPGTFCDACCPEQSPGFWLVSIPNTLSSPIDVGLCGIQGYQDCPGLAGNFVLDPAAAFASLPGVECIWGAVTGARGELNVDGTNCCGRATYPAVIRARIFNAGPHCSLDVELVIVGAGETVIDPTDPNQPDCGGLVGKWRKNGQIGELCRGIHTLDLISLPGPFDFCLGVPETITMQAL